MKLQLALLLLMCLALCPAEVRAQICSQTNCTGCTGTSGCGWCTVLGPGTPANFSQCVPGSVLGPSAASGVVCDASAGSVWHFGNRSASVCGDQCNSHCGSMCSGEQLCQLLLYSATNYQCACHENASTALGMAMLIFVIAGASIAACVGIGIFCYCRLRDRARRHYPQRQAVIITQPYSMATAYTQHGPQYNQYGQPAHLYQPAAPAEPFARRT